MALKNIDTKYLIEGVIDGIDQVEVRKKHAGENRLLKIYISNGGDEFDFSEITEADINSGYISSGPNKNSYYSYTCAVCRPHAHRTDCDSAPHIRFASRAPV